MGRGARSSSEAAVAWCRRPAPAASLEAAAGRDRRRPARVLSIDGGGIRGVIPATVLAELEARTGRPTAELFDLIAGTSTGAIIALALTMPGADGKPKWSAADLVELYETEGPGIFHRSLWRRLSTLSGVIAPKYSDRALDRTLEAYFGDARLSDALADVLVPAYDTERHRPFFFRSQRARNFRNKDFPLREVVRAAVGAPTYFAPVQVTNEISGRSYSLIDGGVFANNPALCAWADAQEAGVADDAVVLSLGTGSQTAPLEHDRIKGWGLRGWAPEILDVVFRGVSNTTSYQLRQLLGDDHYLRLQTTLDLASDKMDRATKKNLAALKDEARHLLDANDNAIDRFVGRLNDPSPAAEPPTPRTPRRSTREAFELLARQRQPAPPAAERP